MGNSCSPAVAGDVFDDVFLCCLFVHEMSRVRSRTLFSQILGGFLPTFPILLQLLAAQNISIDS